MNDSMDTFYMHFIEYNVIFIQIQHGVFRTPIDNISSDKGLVSSKQQAIILSQSWTSFLFKNVPLRLSVVFPIIWRPVMHIVKTGNILFTLSE